MTESNEGVNRSLRVNIELLDSLITLAGELVLSRNQLIQGLGSSDIKACEVSGQRIDLITSELQEIVMRTRMQPISNVLNKFNRVVRDLALDLDKEIDFETKGKSVELDKSILESISAPLLTLVENAVIRGIEKPDIRITSGKERVGKIKVTAYQDAGHVSIKIADDGYGLDPEKTAKNAVKKGLITESEASLKSDKLKRELIFMQGFYEPQTDSKDSSFNGLDMVAKSIEDLGGVIDIDSKPGQGTSFLIKLPLTLAIIPSQIISLENQPYAIPQVNLDELIRVHPGQVKDQIDKIGDAPVLRLRGEILPLLDLAQILGIKKTYLDPNTDSRLLDRRQNVFDRRSKQLLKTGDIDNKKTDPIIERTTKERRHSPQSTVNIAVVSAGALKYGLIVQGLKDSEEIVVKPLGKHLKNCNAFSGATIMGDGKAALILDIGTIASLGKLSSATKLSKNSDIVENSLDGNKKVSSLLTFNNQSNEHFAILLDLVQRIERVKNSEIEKIGQKKVLQYRGGALPLYELSDIFSLEPLPEQEYREIIVFKNNETETGLIVAPPVDSIDTILDIDSKTLARPGIKGSLIVREKTTLLIDVNEMASIIEDPNS